MATKVHMEALSPTMEEGQLVRWLKQEGDEVKDGDVLAEIETDKATMELVARGSGVLQGITLKEGQTAPVGEVIAMIAAEGEAVETGDGAGAKDGPGTREKDAGEAADAAAQGSAAGAKEPAAGAKEPAAGAKEPAADAADAAKEEPAGEAKGESASRVADEDDTDESGTDRKADGARKPGRSESSRAEQNGGADRPRDAGKRVKASPLARRLAEEADVELSLVEGTGPGGRITKADIEAAVRQGGAAVGSDRAGAGSGEPGSQRAGAGAVERDEERAGAPTAAPRAEAGRDSEEVPVSQMRKTIAKRLAQSIGPIPTFYLTIECDMTRLMELRARVNSALEKDGIRTSINDFLIKVVASALAQHPEVNASWGDNVIVRHHRVHVGVAVAVEDGLITPIVRDADRKRVRDIAGEVKELAGRARERKLKPEEYTGATFSVSNLGMFGIVEFTAIINPPEGGILAIGAVEEKPVVVDGEVRVQPRMRMTMSCDHRVIDGATGAKFLQTVQQMVEDPMTMLA